MNTQFHDDFIAALTGDKPDGSLAAQPGFAVYRNTIFKGCVDAIVANYPALGHLTSEKWLADAALAYAQHQPPDDPRLMLYGAGFADFLEAYPPAAKRPWLAGIARADRLWTEAHLAADAPPLAASAIAALSAAALSGAVLRPHPAARWLWRADMPLASLWQQGRDGSTQAPPPVWQGEGLLLTRPFMQVSSRALSLAGCTFMNACAQGLNVGEAALAALHAEPACALQTLMATLLQSGAFCAIEHHTTESTS